MKDVFKFLFMIIVLVFAFWFSFVFFDMVFNSDLSPFWKWILLRR